MAEVIEVNAEQFDAIEAAWAICSWRNPKKAKELWSTAWRSCVADVIGREPPDEFTLRKVGEQIELLDPAEELAAAKASADGAWLSPAAQALYEREGAARFAAHHRSLLSASALPGGSLREQGEGVGGGEGVETSSGGQPK